MTRATKRDIRTLLEIAQGVGVPVPSPRTTPRSKRELAPLEHVEQSWLVQRLALLTPRHPELALLYAVPNGGHRSPKTAAALQREGVRRSVPDLVLPVPRFPYHGLYVELKRLGYYSTPDQTALQAQLARQGYAVFEAHGADEGVAIVLRYLTLPPWPAIEPVRERSAELYLREAQPPGLVQRFAVGQVGGAVAREG